MQAPDSFLGEHLVEQIFRSELLGQQLRVSDGERALLVVTAESRREVANHLELADGLAGDGVGICGVEFDGNEAGHVEVAGDADEVFRFFIVRT